MNTLRRPIARYLRVCCLTLALLPILNSCGETEEDVEVVEIFHTSDVHGHYFSYDFVQAREGTGSLSRVASYVGAYRKRGDHVVLLDGGDLLQGQPTAYYSNFVDTLSKHVAAEVLNYLQYDAMVVGNHDIETGHSVYDRFAQELSCPLLGANVLHAPSTDTSQPYFVPYTIIPRGGRRIAVIGLTTPELTEQLPMILWSGMSFEDQIATAERLMPQILAEQPDLIIALIHSGSGPAAATAPSDSTSTAPVSTNVGYRLAHQIPEIDVVLCGHDHRALLDSIPHTDGRYTYLLNPGPNADLLSHVTVRFDPKEEHPTLSAQLIDLNKYTLDPTYEKNFASQAKVVKEFVGEKVATLEVDLDAKSSYFRPSLLNNTIHEVQLSLFPTAEISFTAPLSERALLPAGDLHVSDLFELYKYENMVYLMEMHGHEIKDYLEESYNRWIHTMHSPDDPLLRINEHKRGSLYLPLENPSFNLDSAAGIEYTIDVSCPAGERITIHQMLDGRPFDPDSIYHVVMNSYRGNGGGGLLTRGAHLSKEEIQSSRLASTDKDLRYYLMHYLRQHTPYTPRPVAKWHFEPREWMEIAIPRDSTLLFAH